MSSIVSVLDYRFLRTKSFGFLVAAGVLCATLLSLFFLSSSSHAQQALGTELAISPTAQRLKLEPAQKYSGTFKVVNSGSEQYEFKVYTQPYQVEGDSYEPVFSVQTNRTQISRWVSFEKTTYLLSPGEIAEIPYTVSVPKDIPSGGQYAVIFAETTKEESDGPDQAVIARKRVGMLLYASSVGDTRESGRIESVKINRWYQYAPLKTTWRISNDGNTDFIARPKLIVNTLGGKKIFESQDQELAVLPDTTRRIESSYPDVGFGIYKVTATLSYLNKTETEEKWVLVLSPFVIIGLSISVVALVGGFGYAAYRRRTAKQAQDS